MAEEQKPARRKPFLQEVEEAILDAGFPVQKNDGTWVEPEGQDQTEEQG